MAKVHSLCSIRHFVHVGRGFCGPQLLQTRFGEFPWQPCAAGGAHKSPPCRLCPASPHPRPHYTTCHMTEGRTDQDSSLTEHILVCTDVCSVLAVSKWWCCECRSQCATPVSPLPPSKLPSPWTSPSAPSGWAGRRQRSGGTPGPSASETLQAAYTSCAEQCSSMHPWGGIPSMIIFAVMATGSPTVSAIAKWPSQGWPYASIATVWRSWARWAQHSNREGLLRAVRCVGCWAHTTTGTHAPCVWGSGRL